MIRGAAKNYKSTAVLTSPEQYENFIREAELNNNYISLNTRKELAKLAFCKTAYYDSLIANWFLKKNELLGVTNLCSFKKRKITKIWRKSSPKSIYFLIWKK